MDNAEFRAIEVDYTGKEIEGKNSTRLKDITPKSLKKLIEKGEVQTVEIPVTEVKETKKEGRDE